MSEVVTVVVVVSIPGPTDGSAMGEMYPTNLTDEQWALFEPPRPPAKSDRRPLVSDPGGVAGHLDGP